MSVKILIAEDSPVQALLLKHILEEHGYEVSVASNGRLALEMAMAIRPALIISDVEMPEMNGYQLTARIKSVPELQFIPVILVTSMSDTEDVIRGLNSGADSFVLKPYEKSYLLSSVQHTLENLEFTQPEEAPVAVAVQFKGRKLHIKANTAKAINLLLSTYEATIQRNKQLVESQAALRKRTAEAVSANRFLDSIIESDPNLISIKEAGTLRYTRINRAFETLIGISRSEMIGKTDHDLFPAEESENCTAIDLRALASSETLDVHEEPVRTRANGRRVLHTKKVTVLDEDGKPSHVLGISEDVTVQRALEGLVQKLNAKLAVHVAELQAINRNLDGFSHSVPYDLRPQYRGDIASLKRRTERLERLVAKLGMGMGTADMAPTDAPTRVRFSAQRFSTQRKRLGLSAADLGLILGVSAALVQMWEDGTTRPRDSQMLAIAAVRKMGKKEAAARLSVIK